MNAFETADLKVARELDKEEKAAKSAADKKEAQVRCLRSALGPRLRGSSSGVGLI